MPVYEQIHATASLLVPELILVLGLCAMFLFGPLMVSPSGEARSGLRNWWGMISLCALGLATMVWLNSERAPEVAQGALFHVDPLVWYTRGISLTAGLILALILWNQIDDAHAAEAQACLLAIIAGTNLVAAADDLVTLFLALELVSIPTYVILYLSRHDRPGREATVKYFLLSIFASALVLYGMAWLYGIAGSTNIPAITEAIQSGSGVAGNRLLPLTFALMLAGLSFRITAVPFHFYAPDVFQGTSNSNAAILSFVPKVVGFVALLRLLPLTGVSAAGVLGSAVASDFTWLPTEQAQIILGILAVVTMFVGNLMALRQTNIYRLMAYSSIAHAGYMLVGFTAGEAGKVGGIEAVLFYLIAYGLMTLGVFALLSLLGTADRRLETDADLRGLGAAQPAAAILLTICLFSLTGLPPTGGFLGKLNLFVAAWSQASTVGRTLAVFLAINAAIAAYYYLRLVALMFLEPQSKESAILARSNWSAWLAGVVCTAGTIVLFFAPQWVWTNTP